MKYHSARLEWPNFRHQMVERFCLLQAVFLNFFKKCIYLTGRVMEKRQGWGRDIFDPLVPSLNCHSGQDWTKSKPGAGTPRDCLKSRDGDHLPLLSQGTLTGIRIWSTAAKTRIGARVACWCRRWWLNLLCENTGAQVITFVWQIIRVSHQTSVGQGLKYRILSGNAHSWQIPGPTLEHRW